MESKVGRPRQFSNAAEKQKAYRQRQKADLERVELGEYMLNMLEERAQTLRNSVSYWRVKGKELDIVFNSTSKYVGIIKDTYHHGSVEEIVFQYMYRRGEFVVVGKRPFGDIVYHLKEV